LISRARSRQHSFRSYAEKVKYQTAKDLQFNFTSDHPYLFSVEGNIGSGKTSLLRRLHKGDRDEEDADVPIGDDFSVVPPVHYKGRDVGGIQWYYYEEPIDPCLGSLFSLSSHFSFLIRLIIFLCCPHCSLASLFLLLDCCFALLGIVNEEGKSLAELYPQDHKRWSHLYHTNRLLMKKNKIDKLLTQCQKEKKAKTLVIEQSLESEYHIFGKIAFDLRWMNPFEFTLYEQLYKQFQSHSSNKLLGMIYLTTSPETCYNLLHIVDRSKEQLSKKELEGISITKAYLETIDSYFKQWIEKDVTIPVLVTDGKNIEEIERFIVETEVAYNTSKEQYLNFCKNRLKY
jgi:deoxyadenosine/deoxycytidine kinase